MQNYLAMIGWASSQKLDLMSPADFKVGEWDGGASMLDELMLGQGRFRRMFDVLESLVCGFGKRACWGRRYVLRWLVGAV